MAVFQFTFKRYERKYLITEEQYDALMKDWTEKWWKTCMPGR